MSLFQRVVQRVGFSLSNINKLGSNGFRRFFLFLFLFWIFLFFGFRCVGEQRQRRRVLKCGAERAPLTEKNKLTVSA